MATDDHRVICQEPQAQLQASAVHQERKTVDPVFVAEASGTTTDFCFQIFTGNFATMLSRLITVIPVVPITSYDKIQYSAGTGTCYTRINVCPCFLCDIFIHDSQSIEGSKDSIGSVEK